MNSRFPALLLLVLAVVLPSGSPMAGDNPPRAFLSPDASRATILARAEPGALAEVRVFDVRPQAIRHRFDPHPAGIVDFGYDWRVRDYLLFGDREGRIGFWPLGSSHPLELLPAHRGPVHRIAISPYGGSLVSVGGDGRAVVVGTVGRQVRHELRGHEGPVHAVSWQLPNRVITGGEDGWLRVFDPGSGALIARIDHRGEAILHLASDFGPHQLSDNEGRYFATTGGDGVVRLWNFLAMSLVEEITPAEGNFVGTRFLHRHYSRPVLQPGEERRIVPPPVELLTWDDQGVLRSWRIPSAQPHQVVWRHDRPISDVALSGPGRFALVIDDEGDAVLIDLRSREPVTRFAFAPGS